MVSQFVCKQLRVRQGIMIASRKTFRTGSHLESKVEDVNTDLMDKLGLAEGSFAGRVALVTGSAQGHRRGDGAGISLPGRQESLSLTGGSNRGAQSPLPSERRAARRASFAATYPNQVRFPV